MQDQAFGDTTMAKPNVLNFSERLAEWATQDSLGVDEHVREQSRFTLIDTLSCMVLGATARQAVAASNAMQFGLKQGSVTPVGGGKMLLSAGPRW